MKNLSIYYLHQSMYTDMYLEIESSKISSELFLTIHRMIHQELALSLQDELTNKMNSI